MLYRIALTLSLTVGVCSHLFASLNENDFFGKEEISSPAAVPMSPWRGAPLVSLEGEQARCNPTLLPLIPQISLANDLSYAISKYFLAVHFYEEHLTQKIQREAVNDWVTRCRRLSQEMKTQEETGIALLLDLRRAGWKPAFGYDYSKNCWIGRLGRSLILGKSGSVDGGFIDNVAGIILYHQATGTLLPVFHGSRGDDFVTMSHDWLANLDASTIEVNLSGEKIKVHRGFWNTADNLKPFLHNRLRSVFRIFDHRINRLLFSGHSHGSAVSAMACIVAAAELGPEIRGNNFNNLNENLFGHFGLSEPAALHIESRDYVRSIVGADNFLHPGALHDLVIQMFRAEFWDNFEALAHNYADNQLRAVVSGLLTKLSEYAPSGKWKSILDIMSDPRTRLRYSHIGHLALEPYRELITRVGKKLLGKMSLDIVAFIGAVHYGGKEGNFDHTLPRELCTIVRDRPYLETMLQVARENNMTVGRFIEDLKAIRTYVCDGEMVSDGAVAFIGDLDAPGAGEAVVALGAGTAAYVIARDAQVEYNAGRISGWGYAARMFGSLALGGISAVNAKRALDQKSKQFRQDEHRK